MAYKPSKAEVQETVAALRKRWPGELDGFTDGQIYRAHEAFSASEDAGDNDAKFPEWFDTIGGYTAEYPETSDGNGEEFDLPVLDTKEHVQEAVRNVRQAYGKLKAVEEEFLRLTNLLQEDYDNEHLIPLVLICLAQIGKKK